MTDADRLVRLYERFMADPAVRPLVDQVREQARASRAAAEQVMRTEAPRLREMAERNVRRARPKA